MLDPEFVWDVSRLEPPESASYIGQEGFLSFFESWAEGFASDRVEAEEIVDAGDRVVVMVHHSGRGRTSGIEVDQRYAMVWTVRVAARCGWTCTRRAPRPSKPWG